MLYKTNDTLNQFMKGTIHFNVLFVVLTLKEILTWKWTKFQFMKETNHFNVLFVELTLQEIPTWKCTMFQIMKKEAFQVQNLWCSFCTKCLLERAHSFDSWRKQAFVIQRGECQQLQSCHRRGPKTVPAQTAEITKCHVIFVVFFKF